MSNPADTFRQEASDLLEGLEENLLELEADPTNRELVDTVFRALHTIKGSGEMFGFSALAKFVHRFENAYDMVRSGQAQVTADLIDISLNSRDHISALLDAGQDESAAAGLVASEIHTTLLSRIEGFVGGDNPPAEDQGPADRAPEADGQMTTYSIYFRPEATAIRNGMRPDMITEELALLGECSVKVLTDQIPALEEIDPSNSYLAWQYKLETDVERHRVDDIFLFYDDGDIKIEAESAEPEAQNAEAEAPEAAGATEAAPADKAEADPSGGQGKTQVQKVESVRVQSYRLDELMDQLGELVIAQARLNRIADRIGEAALASAAEEIERLVTGMRDATLSIRMLPIGGVFGKFRRVVRDLAGELGKSVTLVTEGGETELDKNIIDRLSDPLVHIIRNAVDHGIEDAETRAGSGKSTDATLGTVEIHREFNTAPAA